ncbi:STAS domain-containing protein [Streptomyces sp. LX-29]|uniref:STAS domain-containing protein n=1 Tax=Streptomyces sp. LX-29 TaxID=2900152 RepID=UPI00240D58CF|nr:STAS domain-containing protein [Streptomyces sp. LX-29]WFB07470.1 STAS domain-containing protein [Streptomyces sp. LX-29]
MSPSYAHTYRTRTCTVVEFHGEVDLDGIVEIGRQLDLATAPAAPAVVIDLSPATFVDCSGLSLLCRAHRRVGERGGRLRLVCADRRVLRTLRASGLIDAFAPVPTVGEALGGLGPES